jgi:hypothetical protein
MYSSTLILFLLAIATASATFPLIPSYISDGRIALATFYWPEARIGKCTAEIHDKNSPDVVKRPSTFYKNPDYPSSE